MSALTIPPDYDTRIVRAFRQREQRHGVPGPRPSNMLEATPKRVGWAEITLVEPDIDNAIEGNVMTQSVTNESGNPYRDASSMGTTGAPAPSAAYAVPAAEHTKTASRIGTRFIPWHHGRVPRFCTLWASTVLIVLTRPWPPEAPRTTVHCPLPAKYGRRSLHCTARGCCCHP